MRHLSGVAAVCEMNHPRRCALRVMSALFAIALSATVLACGSAPASPPPAATQLTRGSGPGCPHRRGIRSAHPAGGHPAIVRRLPIPQPPSSDDAGRQVTVQKPPMRIISLASSNTEILYALGLEDRIVGLDQYSDYPPETKNKPKVGSYTKPDLEKIVALEPDLVVATGIHVKAIVPELERHKLTTVVVDPRDVQGVATKVELLARLTGKDKEGAALAGKMRERIRAVETRVASQAPRQGLLRAVAPASHRGSRVLRGRSHSDGGWHQHRRRRRTRSGRS